MAYEDMSPEEIKALLKKWRDGNERKGGEVIDAWAHLCPEPKQLKKVAGTLGSELYVILEQVIIASLDCGMADIWGESCVSYLHSLFPKSLRVLLYTAMCWEAQEKYDDAIKVLELIIKEDETNAAPRKRKVAILKAQGQYNEAIKELVDYLKKFMSDPEAWQELCQLYLRAGELPRAAFCAEELLLHQPHSHHHHQRIADIRYTMGGAENMELAKSYYCQALKLNPDNARARLGLTLVTNNLLAHYKSSGNGGKRKEAAKLCSWAAEGATGGAGLAKMMASLNVAE